MDEMRKRGRHLVQYFCRCLPTREICQVQGQDGPVTKLPAVDSCSLRREMQLTKATEYVTFDLSFRILVFFTF